MIAITIKCFSFIGFQNSFKLTKSIQLKSKTNFANYSKMVQKKKSLTPFRLRFSSSQCPGLE